MTAPGRLGTDHGRIWHDDRVHLSPGTVTASSAVAGASASRTSTPPRTPRRIVAVVALAALLMCSPLLTGCLERSTTVGDRFSGSIVAASSPDNPAGTPQLDVPDSMADQVSVSEFSQDPKQDTGSAASDDDKNPSAKLRLAGTKASFVDLTMGQLAQLSNVIADSFGDTGVSVDLSATRRDDIVRFRGTADLTGLLPSRDYLELNITFGGPISATNGEQLSDASVTWSPTVGKGADFTADAEYADPATAALPSWSAFFGLICLLTVGAVVLLAYRSRSTAPRPGRPAPSAAGSTGTRSTGTR
ncbi:DUF3153 domain-containing protein [Gordonia amarae]|uniref:LppM domain-containing protein n=2 Tax=Gordonia amarae TaxID=36821 RepID=G7GPN6_9ACTN|nr:hypothetical protein [Gordonia amarae]MCS3879578.1 hypothetical protein [Gordonia amarae]QHN18034.1 DUF3153 domain-containing protein [Gordonia amarae]QHN22554.1 DUF3153 domain-containing protein [Gordonia amarae]QHN31421.1 DUF3153 domain-containing protein [Gordonia amarae]QHN40165.1 DUF3153 domain-containing protein [Gordonia amarae]